MAKNAIYSQAIIIEDRFTEKISHRQRKTQELQPPGFSVPTFGNGKA